jgi:hypothetical protein
MEERILLLSSKGLTSISNLGMPVLMGDRDDDNNDVEG